MRQEAASTLLRAAEDGTLQAVLSRKTGQAEHGPKKGGEVVWVPAWRHQGWEAVRGGTGVSGLGFLRRTCE